MLKKTILLTSLLFSQTLVSAETDQYLAWKHKIKDSRHVINEYLNQEISQIIDKTNNKRRQKTCTSIIYKVGLNFIEGLEEKTKIWAEKNELIDVYPRRKTSKAKYLSKSILQHRRGGLELASTINVNGVHFGTDKISHSISMGFSYFMVYEKYLKRNLNKHGFKKADKIARRAAMKLGVWTERKILGGTTTGEFSYADLESNYQGFEMLMSLCDGDNPRIKQQQDGSFELVRPIDFAEYVNPKWDESYYPNYHNQRDWYFIKNRMKRYCYQLGNQRMNHRFSYYNRVDKKTVSSRFLQKLIDKGELPDNKEQSIQQVCSDYGLFNFY